MVHIFGTWPYVCGQYRSVASHEASRTRDGHKVKRAIHMADDSPRWPPHGGFLTPKSSLVAAIYLST